MKTRTKKMKYISYFMVQQQSSLKKINVFYLKKLIKTSPCRIRRPTIFSTENVLIVRFVVCTVDASSLKFG